MDAIKGFTYLWLLCKEKHNSILIKSRIDNRANRVSRTNKEHEYSWFNHMNE